MHKRKVLIVGGGFGGVKAALELSKHDAFQVTLLSDRDSFHYHPGLFHTATGGASSVSEIPLAEIFQDREGSIIIGRAKWLNRNERTITTEDGQTVHYDILILALGTITNYFGIKGLKEYSYGIKSIEEAEELKAHLHQHMIEENRPDLHYAIVGGGASGVELAGALPGYIRKIMRQHGLKDRKVSIDLIEAAPRLMPNMPKLVSRAYARRLRHLGVKVHVHTPVQGETSTSLLMNGEAMTSETVIWTAGTANNPFFKENNFILSYNGKVQVDKLLQAWPGIYVIGDNADTPYSGMAQTAIHDALSVSENLVRHVDGKLPYAYKPKRPVYVTPVGKRWAAVLWGKFEIYGFPGWLLRKAADWLAYRDVEPWWKATQRLLDTMNEEDDCPLCAVNNSN